MKVPIRYAGASGIPLGGIGCGTVEIRGDGRLYEWHIFNNGSWAWRKADRDKEFMTPDDFFFALRVREGERIVVRLLRASRGYELGGDPYTMPWLRSVDEVEFNGEPPFAFLEYRDADLPVKVTIEAFTPLIPGDVEDSALPIGLFVLKLKNESRSPLGVSVLAGMKTPFGEVPARTRVRVVREESCVGFEMQGEGVDEKHCMYRGSIALAVLGRDCRIGVRWGAPIDVPGLRRCWVEFRSKGLLEEPAKEDVLEGKFYVMLTAEIALAAGEEREVPLALAWFFPNFIDELGIRLGHYYERSFSSAWDVVNFVSKNLKRLRESTRCFHDALYSTTVDYWLVDLIASQLTTLQKCTYLTKEGLFGVWEGYGCCGHNTTDVAFYGSVMVLQLFPELEKRWIEYHAKWQLKPDLWPYYEMFALAHPENFMKLKERVQKNPSIATDLGKFREAVREVVKETGLDPTGRVMHFFVGSFKRPDTYDRPDMCLEHVLMVVRDAIWTGDRELLRKLWDSIKSAISVILRTHDPLGLKLLYHYTPAGYEALRQSVGRFAGGFAAQLIAAAAAGYTVVPISVQTFDAWSMIGITSFTGILWLASLKAAEWAAHVLGDSGYTEFAAKTLEEAKANLERMLWNGEYFDLWVEPVSGLRDSGCSSSHLDGQMYLSLLLDLGYVVEREKVLSALRSIYKYNFKGEEGLINGSYPGRPRPAFSGDMPLPNGTGLLYEIGSQIDTPWTGIEFEVAAHMIHEGLLEEALNILKAVHERYARYGLYWNHIECGGHYYRAMDSWLVLMALEGLSYNGFDASLKFAPKINEKAFKGLLTVAGTWGLVEQKVENGMQNLLIRIENGCLKLKTIKIAKLIPNLTNIKVNIDGAEVAAKAYIVDDTITVELPEILEVKRELSIKIS
ncbi:MAG: GH116 family glycosyl hydrolase [Thermofilaceae archaeon]